MTQEQTKVARLDIVQQGTAVKRDGSVQFSRRNTYAFIKEKFPRDVSTVLFHVPLLFCHSIQCESTDQILSPNSTCSTVRPLW